MFNKTNLRKTRENRMRRTLMRKNAVLATAALLLAGSIASAEVKTSITVLQGWDVVGYRQSGADD